MSTLRDALESAVKQVETQEQESKPVPATNVEEPTETNEAPKGAGEEVPENKVEGKSEPTPEEKPEEKPKVETEDKPEVPHVKQLDISKPPVSWKAAAKAKWDQLPVEAKVEAHRRDREVTLALNNSAQARQFYQKFAQTVQPFEAHIRARGVDPLRAFEELIKADYILSTAPAPKRAQFMAMLIKDYGVDLQALDAALAGQNVADPVESKVQTLLEQRLAPLQQFIQAQHQTAEQARLAQEQALQKQIEQMANDVEKYPYFEAVREDMADIIDLQAKRGVYLTLEQAYSRAVALNPELSSEERQRKAAAAAHARAVKAKSASVSVSGAPNGSPSSATNKQDLRSTIEAAFNQATGR